MAFFPGLRPLRAKMGALQRLFGIRRPPIRKRHSIPTWLHWNPFRLMLTGIKKLKKIRIQDWRISIKYIETYIYIYKSMTSVEFYFEWDLDSLSLAACTKKGGRIYRRCEQPYFLLSSFILAHDFEFIFRILIDSIYVLTTAANYLRNFLKCFFQPTNNFLLIDVISCSENFVLKQMIGWYTNILVCSLFISLCLCFLFYKIHFYINSILYPYIGKPYRSLIQCCFQFFEKQSHKFENVRHGLGCWFEFRSVLYLLSRLPKGNRFSDIGYYTNGQNICGSIRCTDRGKHLKWIVILCNYV